MKEDSRRGLAGLAVVFAAFFTWIIIVTIWYKPASVLDLNDQSNMLVTLWWTGICGLCVFVGLQMEKKRQI